MSDSKPTDAANEVPQRLSLTQLPTEIRHRIYHELFCSHQQPILLSRHRQTLSSFGKNESIFDGTGLFRVNRQLHDDSVAFAYSRNAFQIRQDFDVFSDFGQIVRSSMRDLTIFPTLWHQESQHEIELWDKLTRFTALERVRIWSHSEVLLPAIPYLQDLRSYLHSRGHRPSIALDLCVWERHLSFDLDGLDYERSRKLIIEGFAEPQENASRPGPLQQILRLPTHAATIVILGDISAAAARALDGFLMSLDCSLLVKSTVPMPGAGYNGRAQRLWYQLDLDGDARTQQMTSCAHEDAVPIWTNGPT